MLRDLSLSLRAMLTQAGLPSELASAQIVFDHPSEAFSPSQTTVNLFLYDLRENLELRNSEPSIERKDNEVIIRPPHLRMACSYLVTAWPVGGEEPALQEQRLLSQVLLTLRRYPTIPATALQGSLKDQLPPLPMLTAQAEGLPAPHEFWTAIGNKLRPSLTVTVTLAMNLIEPSPQTVVAVHLHEVRLGGHNTAIGRKATAESPTGAFTIGGRVMDKDSHPVSGVTVTLVERNLSALADAEGRFTLRKVSPGNYKLRVTRAGAAVKDKSVTIPAQEGDDYNVQLG